MTSPGLRGFLLARFAEEKWALDALIDDDPNDPGYFSPSRLAAECEARRRIVEMIWASPLDITTPYGRDRLYTLFHLARPYADYPDYDPSWRP